MKAILWDMDGTLVDTEPLWGIATYEMSEQMGRRLTEDIRALTVGGTTVNTVRICAKHAGLVLTPSSESQWVRWMFSRVATLLSQQLPFRPQVPELLAQAREQSIALALVTNTARELTTVALASIGAHHFDYTVCADEVATGKPAPDLYLTAARRLGFTPDDCLVIEDSTAGMTAGRDAGCRVLGVPTEPDVVIPESVGSLATLSEQLWNRSQSTLEGLTITDVVELYHYLGGAHHQWHGFVAE